MAGGIVQTGAYKKGEGKEEVQRELREGLEILIENDIELIIVEVGVWDRHLLSISITETLQYFHCVEEMEWALELALSYNKPVAATMCIGPTGDGKVSLMSEHHSDDGFVMLSVLSVSSRECLQGSALSEWPELELP